MIAIRWVARLLLIGALAARFLPDIGSHEIHGDENWYPRTSAEFFLLIAIDRDLDSPEWETPRARRYTLLGRYLLGAVIFVGAGEDATRATTRLPLWHWHESHAWNLDHGRRPAREVIVAGRTGMALFGVLACLCLYALGTLVYDEWTGLLAALLLGLNPLTAHCARYAMLDAPLLLFMTVMPVITIGTLRAYRRGRARSWVAMSVIAGVAGCFAAGTKPNGALSLVVFGAIAAALLLEALLRALKQERDSRSKLTRRLVPPIAMATIAAVTSIGLFVASQPSLHNDPIGEIEELVWNRRIANRNMADAQPASRVLDSPAKKVERVAWRIFGPGGYTVSDRVPLELIFFPIGLFVAASREASHWSSHGELGDDAVVLTWAAVTLIGVTAWIPFEWDRYFLPMLPPTALLVAVGLREPLRKLPQLFQSPSRK